MAHEVQRIRLRRLAAQIENTRLAAQFAPAEAGDSGDAPDPDAFRQQVAAWQDNLAATRREMASKTNFNQRSYGQDRDTGQPQLHRQSMGLHEMTQLAKRVSDAAFGLLRQLGHGAAGEAQALKGLESAFNHWLKSTRTEDELFTGTVSAHVMTELKRLRQVHPAAFSGPGQGQPPDYFSLLHSLLTLAETLNSDARP